MMGRLTRMALSQSDDILGEIVGESTTREAKRQKLNKASNDDDLFEDFGEIDKVRIQETKGTKNIFIHDIKERENETDIT